MSGLEVVFHAERAGLARRLRRMTGDEELADDLCQETFLRAWSRAPRRAPAPVLAAWLHRTATNLALDELRRRARRPLASLDDLPCEDEPAGGVRDALARLPVGDRAVIALRFQAGLALRELGSVLGISEDAARKRVARARARLRAALDEQRAEPLPLILLLVREDEAAPYERWLTEAGARVRVHRDRLRERDVLFAGGLVVAGSVTDVHPGLYGERPGPQLSGTPDARRDWRDLGALRTALRADLPVLCVCSGHQLLNVATGGTLHQHLAAGDRHTGEEHAVSTRDRTRARSVLGARVRVRSDHHQGVRGRRAAARDGDVPRRPRRGDQRTDRRFALGVQWRPQADADAPSAGRRLAEALTAAAARP